MPRIIRILPPHIFAAATILALLTTGCSGTDEAESPAQSDPTSAAARQRAQCTPADPEGEIIVHPGSLTVATTTLLDDVNLIGAVNLEVVEKAVTPFSGNPVVRGIIRDYPPLRNAGLVDSLADWDERRPLPGLLLEPADGQQAILVALRLKDPQRSGHLVGVSLSSTVADDMGSKDYVQPVLIEPPGAVCTIDELDRTLEWVPEG